MHGARKLKKSELLATDERYELLLRLAAGGMGAVYVAVERGTEGPLYAIKRAHAHLLEQNEFRKMFVAEAQLARRIRHPNAVGVIDVHESDGELMMVMPYIEGGSLSDMLVASVERGRRIAPPVTLRIVLDAARGLDAAHQICDEAGKPLGIVHRDISPHNILVGIEGVSAIVDFGVAKAASMEMTQTATDILKGKTAYMAPEYVKSRTANAQTDVFSLGVVAWETLANRRLFKGDDEMETMRKVLDQAPAPLLHQTVNVDATVGAVVARAVAKDPQKRFHSARDFADALEKAALAADLLATPAEVAVAVKSLLAAELAEKRTLISNALAERRPVVVAAPMQVDDALARTMLPGDASSVPRPSAQAPVTAPRAAPTATVAAMPVSLPTSAMPRSPPAQAMARSSPDPMPVFGAARMSVGAGPASSATAASPVSRSTMQTSAPPLGAATSVLPGGFPVIESRSSSPHGSSSCPPGAAEPMYFDEPVATRVLDLGSPTDVTAKATRPRQGAGWWVVAAAFAVLATMGVTGVVVVSRAPRAPDAAAPAAVPGVEAAPPEVTAREAAPAASTTPPAEPPGGSTASAAPSASADGWASAAPSASASAQPSSAWPPVSSATAPPAPPAKPARGGPAPRPPGWKPMANPY